MNHKQYEKWILDDSPLSAEESELLKNHLASCSVCQKLNEGWQKSLQGIHSADQHVPTAGFTARWQVKLQQEQRKRTIVRRRIIVFSSLFFLLLSLIAYILLSGSFTSFLANLITLTTQIILFITKGLSELTMLINGVPSIVQWSLGIFMIGVANMFIILLIYIIWKARKNHREQQEAPAYAEE